MIYLDHASHTIVDEAVLSAFCQAARAHYAYPSQAHEVGRRTKQELDETTADLAALLGVLPTEIIYTSGASESNSLAIKGIAKYYAHKGRHILSTCLEHPSVSGALATLHETGYEIELLKICPNGTIDLPHLISVLRSDTILLCVSAVDSELGAVQPLSQIAAVIAEFPNCHLHVDAAQAMGKLPIAMGGVSTLAYSPHKFHGITGSGVLIKREGIVLDPQIHGGSGVTLYRGGTPTVALAIAGLTAFSIALREQEARLATVTQLRDYALEVLNGYPKVRINSPTTGSPYLLNLSVTGIKAPIFQAALNQRGVYVSVKSACATDASPSRAVLGISGDRQNALSSWRVSFCHLTALAEVDAFLHAFDEIYRELA